MCRVVEERAKEYAKEYAKEHAQEFLMEQQIQNIKRMLEKKKYMYEEIADVLNVSPELVQEVAVDNTLQCK